MEEQVYESVGRVCQVLQSRQGAATEIETDADATRRRAQAEKFDNCSIPQTKTGRDGFTYIERFPYFVFFARQQTKLVLLCPKLLIFSSKDAIRHFFRQRRGNM